MRWSAGFFRIWVALSVLWVAGVAAITIAELPHEGQPWHHVYMENGADAGTISRVEGAVKRALAAGDETREKALSGARPDP